ncbi:hypothetical protein [Moorena sp. SIO4G3]|uniref:hypothetical protein n=1 Tax=Moorena sp. SIO4G3 TaxID=2607821 RepID=UPI00142BDE87|nr:hypothetical protein [Moorena sp. SIO4G3]NEO77394.1 hypothetical protein [Moorena sp. SIO4G3]
MWRGLIINNVDYEHIINSKPWQKNHATETTYPSPKAKGEQLSTFNIQLLTLNIQP